MRRRDLVMLTPLAPAPTGNGLAMRAAMQLEALRDAYAVRLVVVPVAGGSHDVAWAERRARSVAVVAPGDLDALRDGTIELVRSAAWRERLRRSEPLPRASALAGPGLAGAVAAAAGAPHGAPVHACRSYLAPLAVAVAEKLAAAWVTLDLDEDDAGLLDAQGSHEEARAYERLLGTFGGSFSWLALASPTEAEVVARRHGLRTVVVPNAVDVGPQISERRPREPGRLRLLFVGNLSYEPNVAAAELLATELLPRVRRLCPGEVHAELVGRYDAGGRVAALASIPGIELSGYLDDLQSAYARADLVVVPLLEGGGTRIKILEAFAAGTPVVASAAAVAGLPVIDGREALLAETPAELAGAIERIAGDPSIASAISARARALVVEQFSWDVVGRQLRGLLADLDQPPSA